MSAGRSRRHEDLRCFVSSCRRRERRQHDDTKICNIIFVVVSAPSGRHARYLVPYEFKIFILKYIALELERSVYNLTLCKKKLSICMLDKMPYADSVAPDQPVHPRSLI